MSRKLIGILASGGIGIAVAASVSLGIGAFASESGTIAEAAATPTASATAETRLDASAGASTAAGSTPSPTVAVTPSDAPTPAAGASATVPTIAHTDAPTGASVEPPAAPPAEAAPLTERQQWLVFHDSVRTCMAGEGQEYLYFEWWNPAYKRADGSDPAMPMNLSADEAASWAFALNGNTGAGADYHWEDAGCWGITVQKFGNTH